MNRTLSHSMQLWLLRLRNRYSSAASESPYRDPLRSLCLAVKTIEQAHRNGFWRLLEYMLLASRMLPLIRGKGLTNLSIGQYQLKVSMILDYLGVSYSILKKTLLPEVREVALIREIFKSANSEEALIHYIEKSHPGLLQKSNISPEDLKCFALDYSRNFSFRQEVNYYTALRFLMADKLDWSLFNAS